MDEKRMKTEDVSPSHNSDHKAMICCSPLNLKLSPTQCYPDDNVKVTVSYDVEESIRTKLEDVFLTPEGNVVALEEKARSLRQFYITLSTSEKAFFLRMLSISFGVDHQLVGRLAEQIASSAMSQGARSEGRMMKVEDRLRLALVPRYQTLFTVLSRLENGVRFLLQLRSDVIVILSSPGVDQDSAHLQTMNSVLHGLLSIWMSVGSLRLEKITWESPCDLLQKVCAYEAVQSIRNWSDLKQRVGPFRRCFAFTHVTLPREPVIVIHAAVTSQITRNIQTILGNQQTLNGDREVDIGAVLDETDGENTSNMMTAVFYSITSTQKGLQGIEFGNHLIKRVITELQSEFPRMHQFSSLSPIPGFRDWLLDELNSQIRLHDAGEDPDSTLLSSQEILELASIFGLSEAAVVSYLRDVLLTSSWLEQLHWHPVLKNILVRQCARYLYIRKKRGYVSNAVANFHLCNGAVLWRINWMADVSSRGLAASFGLMINYRYYPDQIEVNSKNYIERRIVALSDQVMDLVRQLPEINAEQRR